MRLFYQKSIYLSSVNQHTKKPEGGGGVWQGSGDECSEAEEEESIYSEEESGSEAADDF